MRNLERGHACAQLVPPEVKDTPEAPKQAKEKLRQMGPMTRDELIMSFTMLGAVVLWVLGDQLQIPAVTAAMLGLTALLMTGVLQWKDCLDYSQACLPASLYLMLSREADIVCIFMQMPIPCREIDVM